MSNSMENKVGACGKAITEQPGILMRKLLKHWSHKLEVRFDEISGEVKFPAGYCEFDASQANLLTMQVSAGDTETVVRLEEVITAHLERMATHQTVSVTWETVTLAN